jgi:lipopolysaccharide biosynthesis glycosyltransferase
MSDCCICYIANEGYLFGTLVGALQAKRLVSGALADIAIFSFGEQGPESEAVANVCAAEDIAFMHVPMAVLDGADFRYARLLLHRFAPERYRQLLYVDGDTQVIDWLDELVRLTPAPGRFAAVRDPLVFDIHEHTPFALRQRARLTALGIRAQHFDRYFNSGVLRINREGWADVGERALEAYRAQPAAMVNFDQDALNIAAIERCDLISVRWNFPAYLLDLGLEPTVAPAIIHFMAQPKPWHGAFPPWGLRWHRPYLDVAARHPSVARFRPQMRPAAYGRYVLQQVYKRMWADRRHLRTVVRGWTASPI